MRRPLPPPPRMLTSLELLLLLLLAWTSVGEAMESCRADDRREEVGEGPGEAISERARAALSSYEKLHARILDPREKKIKRKFLVLQVKSMLPCRWKARLLLILFCSSLCSGWGTLR